MLLSFTALGFSITEMSHTFVNNFCSGGAHFLHRALKVFLAASKRKTVLNTILSNIMTTINTLSLFSIIQIG